MERSAGEVTIELKRYFVKPDKWDEYLVIWRRIVELRRRHGFEVRFAFEDRENNILTWACSNADYDKAAEAYYADPDRAKFANIGSFLDGSEIRRVKELPLP